MSSNLVANSGFAGTGPYKIISPTVTPDASGSTVTANANKTFPTNLPLGFGMLIREVDWVVNIQNQFLVNPAAASITSWQSFNELTEALARTTVAGSDPVDVDIYFDEWRVQTTQATAVGIAVTMLNRQKALERHVLNQPWLSVAQNLNLVCSIFPEADNGSNGPKLQVFARIFFDIVQLTSAQQAYLAQRIQIGGQA
jgi:hypothetical protein